MKWPTMLLVVHGITFFACASDAGSPAGPTSARLDRPFTLAVGASAVFDTEQLQVAFESVLSDSRCPVGAQCIVAGEATVRVSLSKSAGGKENRELKTTPNGSEGVYGAYRIKLVALEPQPRVNQTIRPSDYVGTWLVTRSP